MFFIKIVALVSREAAVIRVSVYSSPVYSSIYETHCLGGAYEEKSRNFLIGWRAYPIICLRQDGEHSKHLDPYGSKHAVCGGGY